LRRTSERGNQSSLFLIYTHRFVIEQQIDSLLATKFQEEEFQDCFLIEVNHHPGNNKLEVFIDSDTGVTFDKCRRISRYLEAILDEQAWLGEKYVLEVSSPGITRPLKLLRQYKKNKGRTLDIALADGSRREGVLAEVAEDHLVLEEVVIEKVGGKKVKKSVLSPIGYDQIQKAMIKIQF
jgi:ribosome maturation factor RimP